WIRSEVDLRAERENSRLQRLRRLSQCRSVIGANREDRMCVQRVEQIALNLPRPLAGWQLELAREPQIQLIQTRQVQTARIVQIDRLLRLSRRQQRRRHEIGLLQVVEVRRARSVVARTGVALERAADVQSVRQRIGPTDF